MTDPDDLVARLRTCELEYIDGVPVPLGAPVNPDGPEAAAEIERLRDLLGRYAIFAEKGIRSSITHDEAKEIVRYYDAARAMMEGEG